MRKDATAVLIIQVRRQHLALLPRADQMRTGHGQLMAETLAVELAQVFDALAADQHLVKPGPIVQITCLPGPARSSTAPALRSLRW